MTIFRIAGKTLLEYWREPQLLLFILLGPACLILLWYIIYMPVKDRMSDFLRILVLNQDSGSASEELIDTLRAIEFAGKPACRIDVIENREFGLVLLRESKAAMMIVIPKGFSNALISESGTEEKKPVATVEYIGDTSGFNYVFAKGFIDPFIHNFLLSKTRQGQVFSSAYEFLPGTGTSADFDASVPGLLVFALLFLIISSASTLVNEDTKHTLERLKMAGVSAAQIIIGTGLAQMALAVMEVSSGFLLAVALGYGAGTEMLHPMRAFLLIAVALLFAVPVISLGMITAAFCRTDGEAASLGSLFLVPMVFLSGILFPMPPMVLFTIAGRAVNVYDLIPSTLATEAIRNAVTFGDARSLAWPILGLLIESAGLLIIGIWLYKSRRLSSRKA